MSVRKGAPALLSTGTLCAALLLTGCAATAPLAPAPVGPAGPPLRVCLDLDASLRLAGGRVHLGMRRSPVHTPEQARA
ncbi:hypothetical protein BU197_09800, partial [Streptomyces sp. CBMA291]|nr:hypothetical protein [Streptomyces sp. CBMA291]